MAKPPSSKKEKKKGKQGTSNICSTLGLSKVIQNTALLITQAMQVKHSLKA